MGKYKLFKIKIIKDWDGEDWDVYKEKNLQQALRSIKAGHIQ